METLHAQLNSLNYLVQNWSENYTRDFNFIETSLESFCLKYALIGRRMKLHMFDSILSFDDTLYDPRRKQHDSVNSDTVALLFAAANGDLNEIQRLIGKGWNVTEMLSSPAIC